MDWASLLYAPIYATLGVDAVLTVACGDPPIKTGADGGPLLVLDKTAGSSASFGNGANRNGLNFSDVNVMTIRPAAMVRATDLADVESAKLRDAQITFNGKTWRVMDHEPVPAPTGEGQGEIRLILEAA
ncbi:hypothetical protein [Mesorhizobium ciceri]|uniref:hypothetical protein n=1 Tax=Mesorhizobium TaxID=68287 RepID=UPI00047B72B7|nr:hypothetical protein [Mesorhizobium ciceri]